MIGRWPRVPHACQIMSLLSGHCATESREAAPGPRAWPTESPGGHVGQPDVSSAVVALTRDEQRVEQLVVVIFDLVRHWCPRSCLASISAAGSPPHGGTGRRWPRRRARVADFCWRPGQTSAATITRNSSRPTTAAADGSIPSANTGYGRSSAPSTRKARRRGSRSSVGHPGEHLPGGLRDLAAARRPIRFGLQFYGGGKAARGPGAAGRTTIPSRMGRSCTRWRAAAGRTCSARGGGRGRRPAGVRLRVARVQHCRIPDRHRCAAYPRRGTAQRPALARQRA